MNGKPLFRWILDELCRTDFISEIIINTDALELITAAGLPTGDLPVKLRERPHALLGDEVSMNRIIEDDLVHADTEHFLMTHTTNPAITAATLEQAHRAYCSSLDQGKDSLFSVNRFQTRFYLKDGTPVNHDPENLIPTQDLEPWFEENSCLYFFSKTSFAATGARIGKHPVLFETPRLESGDIDEPEDWSEAEILLRARGIE